MRCIMKKILKNVKLYFVYDEELIKDRLKTKDRCYEYNNLTEKWFVLKVIFLSVTL